MAARYGGDEFVALLPETDPSGAYVAAEKIRQTVSGAAGGGGRAAGSRTSLSIGVVAYPDDGADGRRADDRRRRGDVLVQAPRQEPGRGLRGARRSLEPVRASAGPRTEHAGLPAADARRIAGDGAPRRQGRARRNHRRDDRHSRRTARPPSASIFLWPASPHARSSPPPGRPRSIRFRRRRPIYQAAAFSTETAAELGDVLTGAVPGYAYSRIDNPTTAVLGAAVAELEGAEAGLAFATGMAAIHAALVSVVKAGQTIVVTTRRVRHHARPARPRAGGLGVTTEFVDPTDLAAVDAALARTGSPILYVETVSNPTIIVSDIAALARIAHRHGALLLVDNTFASPFACRPIERGADLVMHSATKYLSGHADVLAGVVVGSRERIDAVRPILIDAGGALAPLAAFLVLRGLPTLALRMQRHSETAIELAAWLQGQDLVERVYYPGCRSTPDTRSRSASWTSSAGCSRSSSRRARGRPGVPRRHARGRTNGLSRRLPDDHRHPSSTTHRQLNAAELEAAGIAPGLLACRWGWRTWRICARTSNWAWPRRSREVGGAAAPLAGRGRGGQARAGFGGPRGALGTAPARPPETKGKPCRPGSARPAGRLPRSSQRRGADAATRRRTASAAAPAATGRRVPAAARTCSDAASPAAPCAGSPRAPLRRRSLAARAGRSRGTQRKKPLRPERPGASATEPSTGRAARGTWAAARARPRPASRARRPRHGPRSGPGSLVLERLGLGMHGTRFVGRVLCVLQGVDGIDELVGHEPQPRAATAAIALRRAGGAQLGRGT